MHVLDASGSPIVTAIGDDVPASVMPIGVSDGTKIRVLKGNTDGELVVNLVRWSGYNVSELGM